MNQTTKDFITLFAVMWLTVFVQNLMNPDMQKRYQNQSNGVFIGLAYVIGGRTKKQWAKE
tara:strand:+ start:964 stop:1143 length:180 start_codon:yes stop_codon:yes gene_type:complete